MFKIGCQVSGGITGIRTSFLKRPDGKIKLFKTREKAQANINKIFNSISPYSTCSYRYWIEG